MPNDTRWFPVPPVCTAFWGEADWKKWDEMHGVMKNSVGVYEPNEFELFGFKYFPTEKVTARGETIYRREDS